MKKIWLFIVLLSLSGIVFAYNPPVGGQFFYNLADPLPLLLLLVVEFLLLTQILLYLILLYQHMKTEQKLI